MLYQVSDIAWDTDGEQVDLPTSVTYTHEDLGVDASEEDVDEIVSERLSADYGYCHFGFNVSAEPGEDNEIVAGPGLRR